MMYAEKVKKGANVAPMTHPFQPTNPKHSSQPLQSKSVLSSRVADASANRPVSRNPNVLNFNFSGIDIDVQEVANILSKQYPESFRLIPIRRAGFYELAFESDVDLEQLAKQGLVYKNHSIPVSTTSKPMENYLLVTLENTPILSEKSLAKLLETKLLEYGELLDLRLMFYPNTHLLTSKALAFYDLSKSPEVTKRLPKFINFDASSDSPMFLSWKGAPIQCSNCEAVGHIRAKCPKLHPQLTSFNPISHNTSSFKRQRDSYESIHASDSSTLFSSKPNLSEVTHKVPMSNFRSRVPQTPKDRTMTSTISLQATPPVQKVSTITG
ncbi:hypothetical protein BDF22DRAFT_96239 [Syncephalis plumigaleata]|nr:hypothetical protein BDF22DRAFT_96239 [Syncephalis plumigaleata]